MLSSITIGQYFPTGSLLHRLDAAVKILLTVLMLVIIFLANNVWTMALCALIVLTLILLSKVRITLYLRTLKAILPILALCFLP